MPEPDRMEAALRAIVLGLSLIAVGIALWGARGYAVRWWRYREGWYGYAALLLVGAAGMVALVGELVARSTALPFTWRTIGYTVSLGLAIIGTIGIIATPRPRKGENP